MWERAKASGYAYLLVLALTVGMLFHVQPCTFCTNDISLSFLSFLVDACMKLLAHVDTEGLFRKSGSVVRLKALRVSDGRS